MWQIFFEDAKILKIVRKIEVEKNKLRRIFFIRMEVLELFNQIIECTFKRTSFKFPFKSEK